MLMPESVPWSNSSVVAIFILWVYQPVSLVRCTLESTSPTPRQAR